MLKCLMKYEWVKLRRDTLPAGKGIMGAWARLAARAAFRKGHETVYWLGVTPGQYTLEKNTEELDALCMFPLSRM